MIKDNITRYSMPVSISSAKIPVKRLIRIIFGISAVKFGFMYGLMAFNIDILGLLFVNDNCSVVNLILTILCFMSAAMLSLTIVSTATNSELRSQAGAAKLASVMLLFAGNFFYGLKAFDIDVFAGLSSCAQSLAYAIFLINATIRICAILVTFAKLSESALQQNPTKI